nr:MAG TPA: protein of unknown function UPF0697 [Caudoviricetes sp.]
MQQYPWFYCILYLVLLEFGVFVHYRKLNSRNIMWCFP